MKQSYLAVVHSLYLGHNFFPRKFSIEHVYIIISSGPREFIPEVFPVEFQLKFHQFLFNDICPGFYKRLL